MNPVDAALWTEERRALWQRIAAHPFAAPELALDFHRRLARETGWSRDFASGAIAEYRRFCFLAMVSPTPVTPSQEVDAVWHLHLTYSRDYWERWCGAALGGRLHHDPTEGGAQEQQKFRRHYAETLALYERYFGPPPEAFWPGTNRRFARALRFRTIDTDRAVVLPRPRLPLRRCGIGTAAALLLLAIAAPALALPLNPFDWPGTPFLELYIALGVSAFVVMVLWRWSLDGSDADGARGNARSLGVLDLAYLAGGVARACDVALVELLQRGAVLLEDKGRRIVAGASDATLTETMRALRDCAVAGGRRKFIAAATPLLEPVRDGLERRGLVWTRAAARRAAWLPALLPVAVLVFGAIKIAVGSSRGKPVGDLIGLSVGMAVFIMVAVMTRPHRTRAGTAALAEWKAERQRLTRAPLEAELPLALALVGPAVLAGTSWAAYGAIAAAASDSSSGCGGGGGGGSGCGGCSSN
jgi:uncharacterized protein (TIGR04222 family)